MSVTCVFRCTTIRRLIVHESLYDETLRRIVAAYEQIPTKLGDPLEPKTLYGPMHSKLGLEIFSKTVDEAVDQGGKVVSGARHLVHVRGLTICNRGIASQPRNRGILLAFSYIHRVN